VLGLAILGLGILGLAVLRLAVLRLAVLRLAVLGLAVLGLTVLGLAVLGLAVLGLAVLGLAVLGLAVHARLGLRLRRVEQVAPELVDGERRDREDGQPGEPDQQLLEGGAHAESGDLDEADQDAEDHTEERRGRVFDGGDENYQFRLRVFWLDQHRQQHRAEREGDDRHVDEIEEAVLGTAGELLADAARDQPDHGHQQ
jgi:hypothetical protein